MAAKANIIIDQGADFSTTITASDDVGNPVNLTGYVGTGHVRKNFASNQFFEFTVTFPSPTTAGQVRLAMSRAYTDNIPPGRYVYDVEITSPAPLDERTRLVEGIVTVTPSVTRGSNTAIITS
jgi:hypothetical protein